MNRKSKPPQRRLSRRERQIMDILYRLETASAVDVQEALPDPPSYSAVRSALALLVERGHVHTARQGQRYLYSPAVPKKKARRKRLEHLLETFFDGSRPQAALALLEDRDLSLSEGEYDRLRGLLDDARKRHPGPEIHSPEAHSSETHQPEAASAQEEAAGPGQEEGES